MNKKILFIDAFSTIHVGNGALLDNSFKIASEAFKTDNIKVITSDPETNKGRYKNTIEDVFSNYPTSTPLKFLWATLFFLNCSLFYVYQKISIPEKLWILGKRFKKVASSINNSDIIISISGESINDHFAPQMYMRGYLFYICIKLGKDFYVFPQSIGPIFRKNSKTILRKYLSEAKAILARDIDSFKLAKDIWANTRVIYCPDVAVTQESTKSTNLEIFNKNKKVIGITLSNVPNEIQGSDGYLDKMIRSISQSLNPHDHSILLMPSNYMKKGISKDYDMCTIAYKRFLAHGFDAEILKNQPIHPDEYQGIQKGLFLFISSRMHVGILATSASTPTIMLNTQHKIKGYMMNIGMDEYVVEYEEIEEKLPKLIKTCIENNLKIRSQLSIENKKARELVKQRISEAVI